MEGHFLKRRFVLSASKQAVLVFSSTIMQEINFSTSGEEQLNSSLSQSR